MSVIHTYISTSDSKRLSLKDNTYLKQQLTDRTALNQLMHRPINRQLLSELQCILDKKPITRRKTEHHERNGKIRVYKDNKLIKILHANGKLMKTIEGEAS